VSFRGRLLRGVRAATPRELDDGWSPGVVLRRAGVNDYWRALASGADPGAQRWLGWDPTALHAAEMACDSGWLDHGGGPGRPVRAQANRVDWAALVDGQYAGAITLFRSSQDPASDLNGPLGWQVGLVLAPRWRGIGLGSRLFRFAAGLASGVVRVQSISAGCDPANEACSRALLAAGYQPRDGPGEHRLPDGRVCRTIWFASTGDS